MSSSDSTAVEGPAAEGVDVVNRSSLATVVGAPSDDQQDLRCLS
jgi:hypothetical protein